MAKATLVEQENGRGAYDLGMRTAIIDHPKHGRLLLAEGYGGESTPQGGAYRWSQGVVVSIQPTDTLGSLQADRHNEFSSVMDAVTNGRDKTRPLLLWPGHAIEALASSVGR